MDKKAFEVKILDQKFLLQTDSDERYVRKVADYVNEKIFNLKKKTQSVSSLNLALLSALNIADDFFKMKRKSGDNKSQLEGKIKDLINIIDSHLTS